MSKKPHTPEIIRMLRVSNCPSEAEIIVADLITACKAVDFAVGTEPIDGLPSEAPITVILSVQEILAIRAALAAAGVK
jgi:hypothetical protein